MNIFTKFHKDWMTIVDSLLIAKFLASPDNHATPSRYQDEHAVKFAKTILAYCMYVVCCVGQAQLSFVGELRLLRVCHF